MMCDYSVFDEMLQVDHIVDEMSKPKQLLCSFVDLCQYTASGHFHCTPAPCNEEVRKESVLLQPQPLHQHSMIVLAAVMIQQSLL